jgi:dihydrolipoamide dehydrogenase
VKTDRGCIVADEYGRTDEPGIYAIGDVAGPPMLAHKAEHEGVICIERSPASTGVHPMDNLQDPRLHLLQPAGRIGRPDRSQGEGAGLEVASAASRSSATARPSRSAKPKGMVKTIFDKKTGQLLGAHMVGAEVTELIQGFVVAMNLETTEEELMHTDLPAPDAVRNDARIGVLDAYEHRVIDGGADQFVKCIERIRETTPDTTIEILTPDFRDKPGAT